MAEKKYQPGQPMRVRFGPSPTGITHLGSARTALYNYLLAKQTGGQFILRIEDTDQKRYDPAAENDLINSLKWLGLSWDEGPDVGGDYGPYRQSERKALYQEMAEKLVASGDAFYCFCSKEELDAQRQEQKRNNQHLRYAGTCRHISLQEAQARVAAGEEYVIRFKMPKEGTTKVVDSIRGEIEFENATLDDYILVKSDGLAVYHLATMVDDHFMKVTHVLRGEEWIPTFPLHARVIRALGWEEPEWVHLSLFLKPSGKGKMSKRDTEAMQQSGESIFIRDMMAMGYPPEGVINWVALMGWSYDDQTEFFTMDELIKKFSIEKLSAKNAAIDFKKLDHFSGLHVRNLSTEELAGRIRPFIEAEGYRVDEDTLLKLTPLLQPRLITLDEVPNWVRFIFEDEVTPGVEDLVPNGMDAATALAVAKGMLIILEEARALTHENIEQPIRDLAVEMDLKLGQVFHVLRMAVAAQAVTPPLIESMELLGKEKTIKRLKDGVHLLEELVNGASDE
ncbi:MAG: glutamate--tRNA ligase [Anaerolineales bacterium]|nr:glutamate--tRNA ligase [Anaerolineales bacterium]